MSDYSNRFFTSVFLAFSLHLTIFFGYFNNSSESQINANNVGNMLTINIAKFVSSANKTPENTQKQSQIIQENKEIKEITKNSSDNLSKVDDNDLPVSSSFSTKGQRQMPQYPSRALRLKQEGVVYLKILLSENGEIEKIEFIEKSIYPLLNQAAIDAVKKWQFNPTIIDGNYVKSWVEVPIEFRIK